jgi:hypothetical protein
VVAPECSHPQTMIEPPFSADTSEATRLAIDTLRPLFGLKVDAARAAELQPLVEQLLRRGAHLTQSMAPSVEPYFVGPPVRGGAK